MLSVTECASLQDLRAFSREWAALMERAASGSMPGSVFTSPEWTGATWRYAHKAKQPLVLVGREPGGRAVAVLPLARSTRFGLLSTLEVAGCTPIGYPLGDYGGLVAERGYEAQAWTAMLEHLGKSRWSLIDLRNCMANGEGSASAYGRLPEGAGWGLRVREVDVCRRIPLAATFDDYLSGLSSNARQNIRRKLRKLEAGGHRIEVVDVRDAQAREATLQAVFKYHQERWADDPSGGAFPDERTREMHRRLAAEMAEKGLLDLRIVCSAEGEIGGVIYNFRQDGVGYFYQLGFSQDERWSPYSLGVCLLADSIRGAIEAGCHTFDLLRGDHDYKRHFGGTTTHNLRVTIYRYGWLPVVEEFAKSMKRKLVKRPSAHPAAEATA